MRLIEFPVPVIKFGKSDADLILAAVDYYRAPPLSEEDLADLEAIANALEEFLK